MIRGSAVNQDGASNGLTAPNGPAQERVIRQALANAGSARTRWTRSRRTAPAPPWATRSRPGAARHLRPGARARRCGSARSSPTSATPRPAAGVAGVIKMAMAMREGVLPKTLHVDAPSSKVDWAAGQVELLTEADRVEAERAAPPRRGLLLRRQRHQRARDPRGGAAPARRRATGPRSTGERPPLGAELPFVLSAREPRRPARVGPAARRPPARRARPRPDRRRLLACDDALELLATRRRGRRGAAASCSPGSMRWRAMARPSQSCPRRCRGVRARAPSSSSPARAPSGAGWRRSWPSPAPAFAAGSSLRGGARALRRLVAARGPARRRRVAGSTASTIVQPALFAVMVALARLWRACGVEPAAVAGHSQGEIAAAHVAGGSRPRGRRPRRRPARSGDGGDRRAGDDGLDLARRARSWSRCSRPTASSVSLAAVNGPASLVVSGEPEAIEELLAALRGRGRARPAHRRRLRRPLGPDRGARGASCWRPSRRSPRAAARSPSTPRSPAEPLDTAELGPAYWYRNLRQPVRLEPVVRSLLEAGQRTFIEVGPHPVLGFGVRETIEDVLAARRRGDGARHAAPRRRRRACASPSRWPRPTSPGRGRRLASLLRRHRRRQSFPCPPIPSSAGATGSRPRSPARTRAPSGLAAAEHPLLGAAIEDPGGEGLTLTGRLSLQSHPWLADHARRRRRSSCRRRPSSSWRCGLGRRWAASCSRSSPSAPRWSSRRAAGLRYRSGSARPARAASAPYRLTHARRGARMPSWTCHAEGVLAPPRATTG